MSTPKKTGRPPKKPEEKMNVRKSVVFNQSQAERLANSTGRLRVSDSGFMRAASLIMLDRIESGEVDLNEFLEIADDSSSSRVG
jgi:hypothetical protein